MADIVFNQGLGRVAEMAENGDDIRVLLLQAADADATLKDVDTVQQLLALGGTTEADFGNYGRQPVTSLARNVDDGADTSTADCDDVLFPNAGAGQSIVAAVFFKQVTNDADSIVLTKHDAVFDTNGSDVTIQTPNGFFRAS